MEQQETDTGTGVTPERKGVGLVNIIKSTLAAAFGVQTRANRERDFEHGKPSGFIIAGIVFVVVFILVMYGVVQLVLALASTQT